MLVEWMPLSFRASHVAARNSGVYPLNGAVRLRVERSCGARMLAAEPEWTKIVARG
jgi:hypothetical protein